MSLTDVQVWGRIDGSLNSKRICYFIKNSVRKKMLSINSTLWYPCGMVLTLHERAILKKLGFWALGYLKLPSLPAMRWSNLDPSFRAGPVTEGEQNAQKRQLHVWFLKGRTECQKWQSWQYAQVPPLSGNFHSLRGSRAVKNRKKKSLCYLTKPRLIPQQ